VLNGDRSKGIVELTAKPGDTLKLSARGSSDPDGDTITSRWMIYPEAGSFGGNATLSQDTGTEIKLTIPSSGRRAAKNETLHIILTVEDKGSPSLVAYRRAIVTLR
jgi:hypothetical protein